MSVCLSTGGVSQPTQLVGGSASQGGQLAQPGGSASQGGSVSRGWGSAGSAGAGGQPAGGRSVSWGVSQPGGSAGGGVSQPGGRSAKIGQQNEYSLHSGWYASCVHAGGLSCLKNIQFLYVCFGR